MLTILEHFDAYGTRVCRVGEQLCIIAKLQLTELLKRATPLLLLLHLQLSLPQPLKKFDLALPSSFVISKPAPKARATCSNGPAAPKGDIAAGEEAPVG